MKKILGLLATMTLGSTVMTPNIFLTNTATSKISLYTNVIDLPVQPIVQETNYYCIAANIQMIFRYFDVDLKSYSQHRIFQDLEGSPGEGIIMERVPDYLNVHIPVSTFYGLTLIPPNFGTILFEQVQFQNYVYNSLSFNHPLILGFLHQTNSHSYILAGINLNYVRPDLTRYHFIEPADASWHYFTGAYLSTLFRLGGDIVGWGWIT